MLKINIIWIEILTKLTVLIALVPCIRQNVSYQPIYGYYSVPGLIWKCNKCGKEIKWVTTKKRMQVEEWKKRSELGDVLGSFGCEGMMRYCGEHSFVLRFPERSTEE